MGKKGKPFSIIELKKYFAIIMKMSYSTEHELSDYWKKSL